MGGWPGSGGWRVEAVEDQPPEVLPGIGGGQVEPELASSLPDADTDFEQPRSEGAGLGRGEFGASQQAAQQREQDEGDGVQQ